MSNKIVPELVLPGGDLHRVEIAFLYGADAVYVGLNKHSLRKAEVRFNILEIKKAIELAHSLGKKLYITFNIFAHNEHLKDIESDMKKISVFKPDAFIIADPGVLSIAKRVAPKVPVHLSTQANTINSESVKFWKKLGVKRIVLAREATLKEIKEIKRAVPKMEIEVFVHGAMCISYSGRCLMSSALTGRSANLGECTQPCRWPYKTYIEDPSRKNQLMEVESSTEGTYIMNSKDLCLVEHLDKLAPYVDALKIEGRNKTDFYLASVGRIYRDALLMIKNNKYTPKNRHQLKLSAEKITHRPYTTGFLYGDAKSGETFNSRSPIYGPRYIGSIPKTHKDNWATLLVKNKVELGHKYEAITPSGTTKITILKMKDKSTNVEVANPGTKDKKIIIKTDNYIAPDSFLREL